MKHSVLACSIAFVCAAWAQAPVVAILPAHQQESGFVTNKELSLSEQWFDAVTSGTPDHSAWLDQWLSSALPFSFQFGGNDSKTWLKRWRFASGGRISTPDRVQQQIVWTDEETGLQLTWEIKRFTNYPAVEWALTFENKGRKDTPILESIQALNLRLKHSGPGEFTVYGVNGGRSLPDDMTPYAIELPAHDKWRKRTQLGGDFPSSNRHLPFFNLESPDSRGVIIGVGWSGNWQARLEADGQELEARAGLKTTRLLLHPGEQVRTPRILALFWEGKRLHGNNMLRRGFVQPLCAAIAQ